MFVPASVKFILMRQCPARGSIPLAPETVAERAAVLCFAAESVATDCQREQLSYVIGTEVPVPGGEASAIQSVHITHVEDAANTLRTHQKAFIARAGRGVNTRDCHCGAARRGI